MSIFTSLREWFKKPDVRFAVPGIPGFTLPLPTLGIWLSGIWPFDLNWQTKTYTTVTYILILFTVVGEFLEVVRVFGDIGAMCGVLSTFMTGSRVLFIVAHFLWRRRELMDILDKFITRIWISKQVDEEAHWKTEKEIILSNLVSASICGSLVLFCILPYVNTRNLPQEEKLFPFAVDYPYPYRHPVVYPLVYYQCTHAGIASVTCIIAHDTLLNYILIYTCTLLEKLCDRIIDIGEKITGDAEDVEVVGKALAEVVEEHSRLIEFVEQVEDLFSPNIFFQFMVTSLIICVLGIQILFVPQGPLDQIRVALYFITGLGQLFANCYFGQKLVDRSMLVGDAAYNFNWVDINKKYHMNIIMIIQRSQSPLQLTAYKFFSLSMESFSAICSTSASYFALLKQFMEE